MLTNTIVEKCSTPTAPRRPNIMSNLVEEIVRSSPLTEEDEVADEERMDPEKIRANGGNKIRNYIK